MGARAEQLVGRIRIYFGAISQARKRQRRRRARVVAVGVSAALAAAAVAALTVGGGRATGGKPSAARTSVTAAVRDLKPGRGEATFSLPEPAGVILLARISAPRGVRAFVNATIPGFAGVLIATTRDRFGRNPTCAVRAGMNVCTEAVEWCPMPQATWQFHISKSAGPAGAVRVDFIVGPQPHNRGSVAE